jgi:hypothetical protein
MSVVGSSPIHPLQGCGRSAGQWQFAVGKLWVP